MVVMIDYPYLHSLLLSDLHVETNEVVVTLNVELELAFELVNNHRSMHLAIEHPVELVLFFPRGSHFVEVQLVGEVLSSLERGHQVFLVKFFDGPADRRPLDI